MEVQSEACHACHFKIVSWFHKRFEVQKYSLPFQSITRSQLHDGLNIYPFLLTLVSSSPVLGQTEAVRIAGSLPHLSFSKKPSIHLGCLSKSFHLFLLSLFILRWKKANSSAFRVKEMTSVTPLQVTPDFVLSAHNIMAHRHGFWISSESLQYFCIIDPCLLNHWVCLPSASTGNPNLFYKFSIFFVFPSGLLSKAGTEVFNFFLSSSYTQTIQGSPTPHPHCRSQ